MVFLKFLIAHVFGTLLGLIPDYFMVANAQLLTPPLSPFYGDDFSEKQRLLPAVLPKLNRDNCRKLDRLISHRRELNSHTTGDRSQSHSSPMKQYQPIPLHL